MPIGAGEVWETSPTTGMTVGSAPGVLMWLFPIIDAAGEAWEMPLTMGTMVGNTSGVLTWLVPIIDAAGEAWEMSPTTGMTVGSAPGVLTWVVPIIDGAWERERQEGYCVQVSLAKARDIEQYENIKNVMQKREGLAKLGQC
jgi:hypothetical protein